MVRILGGIVEGHACKLHRFLITFANTHECCGRRPGIAVIRGAERRASTCRIVARGSIVGNRPIDGQRLLVDGEAMREVGLLIVVVCKAGVATLLNRRNGDRVNVGVDAHKGEVSANRHRGSHRGAIHKQTAHAVCRREGIGEYQSFVLYQTVNDKGCALQRFIVLINRITVEGEGQGPLGNVPRSGALFCVVVIMANVLGLLGEEHVVLTVQDVITFRIFVVLAVVSGVRIRVSTVQIEISTGCALHVIRAHPNVVACLCSADHVGDSAGISAVGGILRIEGDLIAVHGHLCAVFERTRSEGQLIAALDAFDGCHLTLVGAVIHAGKGGAVRPNDTQRPCNDLNVSDVSRTTEHQLVIVATRIDRHLYVIGADVHRAIGGFTFGVSRVGEVMRLGDGYDRAVRVLRTKTVCVCHGKGVRRAVIHDARKRSSHRDAGDIRFQDLPIARGTDADHVVAALIAGITFRKSNLSGVLIRIHTGIAGGHEGYFVSIVRIDLAGSRRSGHAVSSQEGRRDDLGGVRIHRFVHGIVIPIDGDRFLTDGPSGSTGNGIVAVAHSVKRHGVPSRVDRGEVMRLGIGDAGRRGGGKAAGYDAVAAVRDGDRLSSNDIGDGQGDALRRSVIGINRFVVGPFHVDGSLRDHTLSHVRLGLLRAAFRTEGIVRSIDRDAHEFIGTHVCVRIGFGSHRDIRGSDAGGQVIKLNRTGDGGITVVHLFTDRLNGDGSGQDREGTTFLRDAVIGVIHAADRHGVSAHVRFRIGLGIAVGIDRNALDHIFNEGDLHAVITNNVAKDQTHAVRRIAVRELIGVLHTIRVLPADADRSGGNGPSIGAARGDHIVTASVARSTRGKNRRCGVSAHSRLLMLARRERYVIRIGGVHLVVRITFGVRGKARGHRLLSAIVHEGSFIPSDRYRFLFNGHALFARSGEHVVGSKIGDLVHFRIGNAGKDQGVSARIGFALERGVGRIRAHVSEVFRFSVGVHKGKTFIGIFIHSNKAAECHAEQSVTCRVVGKAGYRRDSHRHGLCRDGTKRVSITRSRTAVHAIHAVIAVADRNGHVLAGAHVLVIVHRTLAKGITVAYTREGDRTDDRIGTVVHLGSHRSHRDALGVDHEGGGEGGIDGVIVIGMRHAIHVRHVATHRALGVGLALGCADARRCGGGKCLGIHGAGEVHGHHVARHDVGQVQGDAMVALAVHEGSFIGEGCGDLTLADG